MASVKNLKPHIFLVIAFLGTLGCSSHHSANKKDFEKTGDYDLAVIKLRMDENSDPSNWKIKSDLGIAYFKNKQIKRANNKLKKANELHPKDGRTLLFLGLSYEASQMQTEATEAYRDLSTLSLAPTLKKEIQVRIRELDNNILQKETRKSLSNWKNDSLTRPPPPYTLAVLYFRNISNWGELNPIIKGLTEIMTLDLSNIQNLHLVDRRKLQILLDELNYSSSEFFDKISTQDAGKLLGAYHLISGSVERVNDAHLSITAAMVNSTSGRLEGKGTELTGTLSNILQLEKQLVFDLIKQTNADLTHAQKKAIAQLPTQNYLAFIAFCKALDFEDKKLLTAAREQYQKAVQLDPDFEVASQKLLQLPGKRLTVTDMEKLIN